MIELFYWPTPNGWKVTIMLEECGLEYKLSLVDIGGGDQFKPDFLRISPNNRMPAIIDHDPADGGVPISVFESGAILEYLADKTGKFLPQEPRGRAAVLQWVHWQMANLGPMMGNANHFANYAKNLVDDEKQLEYGAKRFTGEVDRLSGVMNTQLESNKFLAGNDYSIADMITWPWACLIGRMLGEDMWEKFPHLKRWVDEVGARPAVKKGFEIGRELRERKLSPEEEERRKKLLFNQNSQSVADAKKTTG